MGNLAIAVLVEALEGDRILDKHSYFNFVEETTNQSLPESETISIDDHEKDVNCVTMANDNHKISIVNGKEMSEDKELRDTLKDIQINKPKISHKTSSSVSTPTTPGSALSLESTDVFTNRWGDETQGFEWNENHDNEGNEDELNL